MSEPIKIKGVVKEDVGRPRNDGTPGSGLYEVPLQLSDLPSHRWAELFARNWDRPPQFSTMHRPGIARVFGDRIVLDGTTMEELEQVHMSTLKLVIDLTNEQEAQLQIKDQEMSERDRAEAEAHRQGVDEIADRLDFEWMGRAQPG